MLIFKLDLIVDEKSNQEFIHQLKEDPEIKLLMDQIITKIKNKDANAKEIQSIKEEVKNYFYL